MRVGVIGACGWAGQRHAEAFVKAGVTLAYLVDSNSSCRQLASRFGALASHDFRDMLDAKLDAVSIALPPVEQPEICKQFLSRGVSVLCEKPVAASADLAEDIRSFVDGLPGAVFMPAFLLRFHPALRQIRAKINAGELGRIHELRIDSRVKKDAVTGWRLEPGMGGVTLVNGIHAYDLARWMLGEINPPTFSETGNRFFAIPTEDWAESTHLSRTGVKVCIRSAWWPFREDDEFALDMEGWVLRLRIEGELGCIMLAKAGLVQVGQAGTQITSIHPEEDLFLAEIMHFVECIRNRKVPDIDAADNLAAQKLVASVKGVAETMSRLRSE